MSTLPVTPSTTYRVTPPGPYVSVSRIGIYTIEARGMNNSVVLRPNAANSIMLVPRAEELADSNAVSHGLITGIA